MRVLIPYDGTRRAENVLLELQHAGFGRNKMAQAKDRKKIFYGEQTDAEIINRNYQSIRVDQLTQQTTASKFYFGT
jgi:hypothetical protein